MYSKDARCRCNNVSAAMELEVTEAIVWRRGKIIPEFPVGEIDVQSNLPLRPPVVSNHLSLATTFSLGRWSRYQMAREWRENSSEDYSIPPWCCWVFCPWYRNFTARDHWLGFSFHHWDWFHDRAPYSVADRVLDRILHHLILKLTF